MAKTDVRTKIKPNLKISEPSLYKILYINDDVTTMEFVVSSLITFFDYDEKESVELTHHIHEEGSAVVAIMPYELAEQKGLEVTVEARKQGFPLQVKIESRD